MPKIFERTASSLLNGEEACVIDDTFLHENLASVAPCSSPVSACPFLQVLGERGAVCGGALAGHPDFRLVTAEKSF